MKLAGSTLTFRRMLLPQAADRLRRLGFDTIDLCCIFPSYCPHFDPTASSSARTAGLEEMLEGLRITTFNVGLAPWNSTDRAIRTAQAEFVAGSLRVAKATGAYAVTVPAGSKPKLASDWDVTARIAAETMRPVAKIAESLGLQLSIEIHLNTLVENVEQAEKMIELLQAPAVGVTLDTSHLAAQAMDPVAAITRLGSRIQHVHLRDAKPGSPHLTPGEGAVDFAGVARALREVHYDRPCALELEYAPMPLAEIEENVRRGRAHIEQAFAETTG